jgi:hypothetical protein
MGEMVKEKNARDVEELLLPGNEKKPRINIEEELQKDKAAEPKKKVNGSLMTVVVVLILTAIGMAIVYTNDNLSEQFDAIMRGELGKYKEELRKVKEDRIRDQEELTVNKYGSVTLFYSPKDSIVTIQQKRYAKDCSQVGGNEEDVLVCLKKDFDYTKEPEVKDIENKSQKLDREKKEVVDSIPFNDIPIQESNEERTIVWTYEMEIQINREGYEPRKFHFTGEKNRLGKVGEGWESKYWDQKGPGVFMVDFQGADLLPKPETAKNNYIAAVKDMECIKREIATKRAAGKVISEDSVNGVYSEILNKHELKTFEEYDRIDQALRATDAEWYEAFHKEVGAMPCEAATK